MDVPSHRQIRLALQTSGGSAELGTALLEKLVDDLGLNAEILPPREGVDYLDSLRAGNVDLVAAPLKDSSGFCDSVPYDDSTAWMLRSSDKAALRAVNFWLSDVSSTRDYPSIRKAYARGRGGSMEAISRYDSQIRHYSEAIGWDWRLVAAIIYRESRFSNDAESGKGAVGLMQIMPLVHSADTLSDPSVNLSIGTKHLRRLERQFSSMAASPTECLKFTLAAYNAGEGRIQNYINYAILCGADYTHWSSVMEAATGMEGFKGRSIIGYVDSVLDTWYDYTRLYRK